MKRIPLLLVFAALALAAPGLRAQTVRGSFVDPASGEPIAGARAVLRGADGREAAAAMTGVDGGFVLRTAAAGTYALRVERIGYAATETAPFALAAGETVQRRVDANAQRIALEGIVIQARSRCTPRPGSGPQTAAVWTEARKVLGSARETGESDDYRYAVRRYWRSLDPRGETILKDTVAVGELASGTPFMAVPLERLSRFGYVEQDVAGFVFHAPDARVLLSDEFQERHCFALEEGADGLIGLSFEPVSTSKPDVRGTLWLDRATAELRRMEYRYTQVPGLRREGDAAGGKMEFARLPDGRWIVGRWTIRMPIVTATRVQGAMPFSDPSLRDQGSLSFRVAGIREEGGEVLSASATGDAQVALAASGTLAGTVWDSTASRPLAGATVSAAGHQAVADSLGRFTIPDLPAGDYQLTFAAPRLDSLRFTPAPVRASVREGSTTEQALSIPPLPVVWAARCEAGAASTGTLVGTVQGAAGEPQPGARVTASWTGAQPGSAAAVADSQGVYRVCGAPAGVPLTVRAVTSQGVVTLSSVVVPAGRPRREDLALPAARVASSPAARTAPGAAGGVSGVLRDASGRPLAGASVRVGTSPAVTTDAQGRFRVRAAAGMHAVAVTHPSIGSRGVEVPLPADAAELELRAGAGATLAASVQRVVQLAAIGARAQARRPGLDTQGFYDRQKVGIGAFLTGAALDRGPGGRLSDALRQVGGVRVMQDAAGGQGSASQRALQPKTVAASIRGSTGISRTGPCLMQVYVDGMRVSDPNLDEYLLAEVEAVEVYRGGAETPSEYRNSLSSCGVILIWTRR